MKTSLGFILVVILANNVALALSYNLHSYGPFLGFLSILVVEFLMLKLTDCLYIYEIWLLIEVRNHMVKLGQLDIKKDAYLESLLLFLWVTVL